MYLVATPDNPIPEGAIVTPVGASDGVILRVARWTKAGPCKGTVCVLTGRGEFIEKYFETISELIARNFTVVAMDWRGQGMSGRQLDNSRKGHVDDFSLFERDLDALDKQVLQFLCPRPFFALGHSMGGTILLSHAMSGASPFTRLVVTAPMIGLYRLPFPSLVRGLVEVLDIVGLGSAFIPRGGPRSSMMEPFETNVLTSDRARFARNASVVAAAPYLSIGDPTIGWLNAAFRLMGRFAEGASPRGAAVPTLCFTASEDRVVSSAAAMRYFSSLKTALVVALAGSYHEVLQEKDSIRSQFWAAFDAFIPGETHERALLESVAAASAAIREDKHKRSWLRRLSGARAQTSRAASSSGAP